MGGSRPSIPDTSAQQENIRLQNEQLKKAQEDARLAKENLAQENTESIKSIRRRQKGRSSLITTSERGFKENNKLTT